MRLLRAKVVAGEMTEAEATAMLGTSPFAAQGKIPALWPTPDAGMAEGSRALPPGTSPTGRRPDGKKAQVGLTNAVKLWPTPGAANANHDVTLTCSGDGRTEPNKLGWAVAVEPTGSGKLSAAWVTRLMGFPDGWLDVD